MVVRKKIITLASHEHAALNVFDGHGVSVELILEPFSRLDGVGFAIDSSVPVAHCTIRLHEHAHARVVLNLANSCELILTIVHEGVGASSSVYLMQRLSGMMRTKIAVRAEHHARETEHHFTHKALVQDHAYTDVVCHVAIGALAEGAVAEQQSAVMLRGEHAYARTVPALEIERHDVQCKHGSSVGTFDEEDLFYAASRGIDRETACALLCAAFFDDMLNPA